MAVSDTGRLPLPPAVVVGFATDVTDATAASPGRS